MTTPVAKGFVWTDTAAGRALVCEPLQSLAPHLFTSRPLSFPGPERDDDYRVIGEALEVPARAVVRVRQVHGRTVRVLAHDAHLQPGLIEDADAIVSTRDDCAIVVRVADCVPILVADRRGRAVAAIHAGWRGMAAGVVRAAIETLGDMGVQAGDLVAAIGPSIGPCCYQVDDRVRDMFLAATPDAAAWFDEDGPGHWRLDLWRAGQDTLMDAGVPESSIHLAQFCTADHPDVFFSHRREGDAAGRMVAAIRQPRTSPASSLR
jgi:YfiH family protein